MHSLKIILATVSVAVATPANLFARTACSTPDGSGTCVSTSSCSGFSVANYCPGPTDIQCCVTQACNTPYGSGTCKNTGNGCSGGSFVPDYCPGDSSIQCCVKSSGGGGSGSGSGGDSSTINGEITRAEIILRGKDWISKHVPYNQDATYPDLEGTEYRTDCSGFVSMAIHTTPPGYTTVSLPDVATEISWDALQPGDFVGTLGSGTGGDNGHVTLFVSWVDESTKQEYNSYECRGQAYGCIAYQRPIGWTDGSFTSKPYKYIRVE